MNETQYKNDQIHDRIKRRIKFIMQSALQVAEVECRILIDAPTKITLQIMWPQEPNLLSKLYSQYTKLLHQMHLQRQAHNTTTLGSGGGGRSFCRPICKSYTCAQLRHKMNAQFEAN
jgi:hypothetical protein